MPHGVAENPIAASAHPHMLPAHRESHSPPERIAPPSGVLSLGYPLRSRQAMRDCNDHSSMNPGEALCENRPPDCANEARLAS
jgi:hypothetical protein